ncbi:MAG: Uma2 family endonuclease [Leptolyngbya sp.]|nr:Uma2 family endonuclease [Leptolyngbya sp.]
MVTRPSHSPPIHLPPLENGDRLSRPEFERRYAASAHVNKAELIEGIVYVASPLRFIPHAEPHGRLATWLGTYAAMTPLVSLGIEPTLRLDLDNEPQPDAVLRLEESVGGQSRITETGYLEGTPELVAEIAASSAAIDLGDKKNAYRRNGIPEYLVWNVYDNQIEWLHLVEGIYQPLPMAPDGNIHSRVFPGLWLAVDALLSQDMRAVLTTLQAGLRSGDYQTWAASLTHP